MKTLNIQSSLPSGWRILHKTNKKNSHTPTCVLNDRSTYMIHTSHDLCVDVLLRLLQLQFLFHLLFNEVLNIHHVIIYNHVLNYMEHACMQIDARMFYIKQHILCTTTCTDAHNVCIVDEDAQYWTPPLMRGAPLNRVRGGALTGESPTCLNVCLLQCLLQVVVGVNTDYRGLGLWPIWMKYGDFSRVMGTSDTTRWAQRSRTCSTSWSSGLPPHRKDSVSLVL